MHCVSLTTPKVLILDSERLDLLISRLSTLQLSVILVRPSSPNLLAGSRVGEWSHAITSYAGSDTAWKKEPDILPDDNATVSPSSAWKFILTLVHRFSSRPERQDYPREFSQLNAVSLEIRLTVSSAPAEGNLE